MPFLLSQLTLKMLYICVFLRVILSHESFYLYAQSRKIGPSNIWLDNAKVFVVNTISYGRLDHASHVFNHAHAQFNPACYACGLRQTQSSKFFNK